MAKIAFGSLRSTLSAASRKMSCPFNGVIAPTMPNQTSSGFFAQIGGRQDARAEAAQIDDVVNHIRRHRRRDVLPELRSHVTEMHTARSQRRDRKASNLRESTRFSSPSRMYQIKGTSFRLRVREPRTCALTAFVISADGRISSSNFDNRRVNHRQACRGAQHPRLHWQTAPSRRHRQALPAKAAPTP